ncbi:MAG: hypothetical protein KAV83_11725 [Desulfobacterales bacterium]|nr:hypothetical protein [Desulfobacterales bacterium]
MAESKSHKVTANRLATRFGAEYNRGQGADIQANDIIGEIETPETVDSGMRQLRGYRKPVYVAGTNKSAVAKALEATKGTTVGVMDNKGSIIKKSMRGE